jgi:alcohol dehydrogenase
MRALVVRPGGRAAWRQLPAPPSPGPLGAVVRPIAIATCDMDRPIGLGATPFVLPLCLGHECFAEVLSVGSEVERLRAAQRRRLLVTALMRHLVRGAGRRGPESGFVAGAP